MARVISDELHARLVAALAKDEAVAVFQQLLLAPRTQDGGGEEEEKKE